MWLLFLDLKKDECLSGDEVAVLEPILNHVAISWVRAAATSHSELYTNFSSGSLGIVMRLMTWTRISIRPLSARKSPARRLKTDSLWGRLYSTTMQGLRVPSVSLYTHILSTFLGFGFELDDCCLRGSRRLIDWFCHTRFQQLSQPLCWKGQCQAYRRRELWLDSMPHFTM